MPNAIVDLGGRSKLFRSRRFLASFVLLLLVTTPAALATTDSWNTATMQGMPVVTPSILSSVLNGTWVLNDSTNAPIRRCLIENGVAKESEIKTRAFREKTANAALILSYAYGLNSRPTDVANLLQSCLNKVNNPDEVNASTSSNENYASTGVHSGVRSYASASMLGKIMIITYLASSQLKAVNPSPTTALADRIVALHELASIGVRNPKVMKCAQRFEGKKTEVPAQVAALAKQAFTKFPPVSIYKNQAIELNLQTESSVPHICIYSWGTQQAYAGPIPPHATRAVEVQVEHGNTLIGGGTSSFMIFALFPNEGWKQVSGGTSP